MEDRYNTLVVEVDSLILGNTFINDALYYLTQHILCHMNNRKLTLSYKLTRVHADRSGD